MALWYRCLFDDSPDSQWENGVIKTRVRIPAGSPWFDGHFPETPVLPGVAQLSMVHDLICRASNQRLPVLRVSRVRFKQMIRPGQGLTLTVLKDDSPGSYHFRITGDDGLICTGQLKTGTGANEKTPSGKQTALSINKIRPVFSTVMGRCEGHQRRPTKMAVKTDEIILRIAEIMINELKLEDVTPGTFDPDIDLVD